MKNFDLKNPKWQVMFIIIPIQPGWRQIIFWVMKPKENVKATENEPLTKKYFKGFYFRFMFWLPLDDFNINK